MTHRLPPTPDHDDWTPAERAMPAVANVVDAAIKRHELREHARLAPGSPAAIARACTCDVKRNRQGRGIDGVYVVAIDCPLHGAERGRAD